MIASLIFLTLAIAAYSISQLQQHGKLKWMDADKPFGFWGKLSHRRKYKTYNSASGPRFPLSTTVLVFLTDGYHFAQAVFLLCISLSVVFAIDFSWVLFGLIWLGIHGVHFLTYKLLQK